MEKINLNDLFDNKTRYTKCKKIGDGRFSKVYRAFDTKENREVVIKIQRKGKDNQEVLNDEISLFENLSSDCIIKFYGSITLEINNEDNRLALLLEPMKCDLLKLKDDIYKGAIPVNVVKLIAKQLLQGLSDLHKANIVHTDIKPENVFVKNENNTLIVKLGDLGSGCYVDKQFTDNIGTTEYRSPEVILCSGYNQKTDIWATACLVFELLTDDYLFDPQSYIHDTSSDSETEDSISSSSSSSESTAEEDEIKEDHVHLYLMENILGKMPKYVSRKGVYFSDFYHRKGNMKDPLVYVDKSTIADVLHKEYNYMQYEAEQIQSFLLPMLEYDPDKRVSAYDALKHEFLKMA